MEFRAVTVSVPEHQVSTLLRYAAELADDEAEEDATETSSTEAFAESVRAAYLGGASNVWRPMLRFLAERAGEWVDWPEIYRAMDRTARQMSGALGAAERRCHGQLPYEKRKLGGQPHQFRMSPEAAAIIQETAATKG